VRPAPLLALALLAWLAPAAAAAQARGPDVHGAPLPRGARSLEPDRFASPHGFRGTVDFYRRELARRGARVDVRPVERARDVTFQRILSRDPSSPWRAIHIVLAEGRTTIYILPAPKNELIGDRLTAGRMTLDHAI
jgi:hypothetical protein